MRRLISLLIVVGLVLGGAVTQGAAASMAMEPCSMRMAAGSGETPYDSPQPMKGVLCIASVGCPLTVTLPAPEASAIAQFASTRHRKTGRLTGLYGRSIKPDLTPPIVNG